MTPSAFCYILIIDAPVVKRKTPDEASSQKVGLITDSNCADSVFLPLTSVLAAPERQSRAYLSHLFLIQPDEVCCV